MTLEDLGFSSWTGTFNFHPTYLIITCLCVDYPTYITRRFINDHYFSNSQREILTKSLKRLFEYETNHFRIQSFYSYSH